MSSTWIVKDPSSVENPSWSVRVAGDADEVTTHARLSGREARLALYRVMVGLPPVEAEARPLATLPVAEERAPAELAAVA
jgi:hypothetical protein